MVLPAAPKFADWRTGQSFSDWRDTPSTFRSASYASQLPTEVQGKPAFSSSIGNSFWDSVLGKSSINGVVDQFGAQGVGTVYSGSGFGQFTADADQEIQAAAAKYGVPANFLKSVIAAESSGNWAKNNWVSNNRPASGGLLPYIGVYQNAADSRGLGALFQQAIGNRALQTELLAGVLRSQYDQLRKLNPSYSWNNVASYHYSGQPVPNGWTDEFQNMSNNTYTDKVVNWWKSLDQKSGNTWNAYTAPSSQPTGGIESVFGGSTPRVSQEFGLTEFAKTKLGSWYSYGSNYGVTGHAGVDYSMNTGSKVFSPVGGTVIRAGGSGYYTDERFGNQAGTGELRIKLDNGDEMILGHMQAINYQVGQKVKAGDLVGLSGTFNGGHVHLEYRQYAPGKTTSDYLAVDPRTVLTGASIKQAAAQVQQQRQAALAFQHAGIQAARAAAAAASTSPLAQAVYGAAFSKAKLAFT